MTAGDGGGLAPWLAVHGIDPETCARLLGSPGTGPSVRPPDPPLPDLAPWPFAISGLGHALPQAAAILDRIARDVRIDASPDKQRFPRAFTLHDDGRGLPFVSCPFKGRSSDIMMAAHELGHVCQVLSAHDEGRVGQLPPVLRETAAFLSEELVIATTTDPALSKVLRALHDAHSSRIAAKHGQALLAAIANPATPYTYGWNYPVARDLAAFAAKSALPDLQWQVLCGRLSLTELISLRDA